MADDIGQRIADVYGNARKLATVGSEEDQGHLEAIRGEYPRLGGVLRRATVKQSANAPGDDRHLEFWPAGERDNPVPGRTTFEMFDDVHGEPRKRAIAADALHGLHGDKTWEKLRGELVGQRSPAQRRIDGEAFGQEHEPGDNMKSWMDRSRSDAYVRAGLFPEDNPEWQDPNVETGGFTPEQKLQFARMQAYLRGGEVPGAQDIVTALQAAGR